MSIGLEAEYKRLCEELDDCKSKLFTAQDELGLVKAQSRALEERLADEVAVRAELQQSKDCLSSELEELTRNLFEEANGMVASEAKARFNIESVAQRLQTELDITKERLKQESQQLSELKKQMEKLIVEQQNPDISRFIGGAHKSIRFTLLSDIFNDKMRLPDDNAEWAEFKLQIEASQEYSDFLAFLKSDLNLKDSKIHSSPFLKRIIEDDIDPCLNFCLKPKSFVKKLIDSLFANTLILEAVSKMEAQKILEHRNKSSLTLNEPKTPTLKSPILTLSTSSLPEMLTGEEDYACDLCAAQSTLPFKIKLEGHSFLFICQLCRDKIAAVGDLYSFVRMLRRGLLKGKSSVEMFLQFMQYKRQMFYSRTAGSFFVWNDFERFLSKIVIGPLQ